MRTAWTKKLFSFFALTMSIILMTTCELPFGLGSKLDLRNPEIALSSPLRNEFKNGIITIAGEATDDIGIKTVSVALYRKSRTQLISLFSNEVQLNNNTFSLTIDTSNKSYDGEIIIIAKAVDVHNKETEQSLPVFIDNENPNGSFIFLADRGVTKTNPFNGKEIIKGTADDGTGRLASVKVFLGGVQIFPTATNPNPSTSELTSWSTTIDTDEIVKKEGIWEHVALTKVPDPETDTLYTTTLKLQIIDAAGNSQEYENTCYFDLQFDNPQITWPASLDVSTAANYPRNPTQYSGNIFKNGDTIDITVEDDDAVNRSSAKLILESSTGTKYEYTVANSGLVANPSGTTKTTSVRFRLTVPQEAQLSQGEYKFSFEVSDDAAYKNGKAAAEVKVENKSFVIDNGPPTLTVNSLASNVLRSDAFTLSGTASDGWDINSVQISLDGGSTWQDANLSGSAGSYTWTWNGTSTPEGYYNVQVRSVDRGGSKSSRDLQVTIDNTMPDLSFNQVYPIVESSGKKVNGIIRASVTAADTNGLTGVRYWVYTNTPPDESSQNWNGSGYVELSSAPYAVAIDTTSLTGTLYLRFGARDKAGNTKYITYDPLTIDQSTDNPTINLTNLNQLVSTWAGAAGNLLESNARIIGLLSDDDGIDSTTVQIRYTSRLESSSDPLNWGDWQAATSASSTSFDYTLPSDIPEGVRAMEVRVSDKAALKDGKPSVTTTIGPFYIAIDRQAPSLAVNSPSFGSYKGLGTFQIQGTASDSFALKDIDSGTSGTQAVIVRTDNANFDDTSNNTLVTVASDGTWSYSYTVNAGVDQLKTFYILARDYFNKQTVISHEIRLDTVAPTITITNPAVDGSWFESLARFDGSANDTTGIKTIYYWIGNATDTPPATGNAAWASLAGNVNWSATVDLTSVSEGSKKFWVYSEDLAGNVSTPQSLQFYLDKANPTISGVSVGDGAYRNTSFSLSATLGDSYQLKRVVVEQMQETGSYVSIYSNTSLSGTTSPITIDNLPRDPGNPAASTLVDAEYTYRITVEDLAGKTTQLTRRIIFDDTKPVVEITSFTKYATANKVNKTVTFNALASDTNGLEGIKYFVSTNGTTAPAYDATVGGSIVQVLGGQTIDTTTLADNTQYYLWVVAKDKAGNEGNSTAQQFVVYQSTDIPMVTFTSVNPTYTTQGDAGNNLLVSGGKISGTVTDDDGLPASGTLYIDLNSDNDFADLNETVSLTLTGTGLTKTFDYDVSGLSDGTYRFTIDVTDTTGVHNTAIMPIWFAYDTAVPAVTFNPNATDNNPVGPYRNTDFTVQGTVQDANGISKVEFSFDNGGNWEDLAITATPGENKAWTRAITAVSNNGAKTLLVRATDAFGRTSIAGPVTVTIDTGLPSGTINPFAGGYYADALLAVSGTASDTLSGVAKVEYSTTSSTGPWTQLTGTTTWFKNDIPASGLPEGTGTVWIKITDNAGNESNPVLSATFTVDHNAPLITVDSSFNGAVYKNAEFTIFGTVSDTNLGANPIAVTAKKDGANHTLSGTFTYNAGSWSQVVNISGSGSYEITITATDAVGRQSVEKRTITVDQTNPSLEITSVLPQLTGGIVNGKITLSANASDANGLDGVKYFFRNDASTPDYTDPLSSPVSALMNAPYSVVIDTTNAAFTNNTTYTLWVVAQDRAGNVSRASTTITIQQSSDMPQGTIDSPANTEQIGADRKVRGTFQDDDGVALNGAVLYVRKQGAGSYTSKPIALSSSAGQLVAWTVDITDVLTAGGDGTYEMYLGVTDDATRKSALSAQTYTTSVQTFLYDVNPPSVSSLTPAPSKTAYKAGDAITFSWTASDAGSGLASQAADVDGSTTGLGSITNPSGNNYQVVYTVPSSGISSGNKTITLVVTDGVGRTATRTYTFLVDVDAPVVDPAFTLDPGFVGSTPNGTFLVKGTAADNRGLDRVEINFSGPSASDGSNWWVATLVNGNWSYSVNSTTYVNTSGTLTIKVRAIDQAGNISSEQTFTQAVDQAADLPVVTIISPVDGSTYGTTVQISGIASDDDNLAGINPIASDAIEVQWKPSAGTYTTVNPTITGTGRNANWNYELSGLASGTYVVRARARDVNNTWGNWTSEVTFTVNAGAPSLTISTSVPAFLNNASLTLNGTASDPQGVQYVRVRINGGSWQNASAISGTNWMDTSVTWQINLNLGSDGFKTLEVQAADGDSYASNQQLSTTLDTTPPDGAFDAMFRDHPTGSFLATNALNKVVRITGSVTEANLADTNPVEISINGGAYQPVTGTLIWYYVWDTSALANGDYELRLRITDKAGNVTTSIVKTVTTNQAADTPQITQAFVSAPSPADAGNNVLSTLLKVSGTLSDDDGFNTGAVTILLDGTPPSIGATNTAGTTATWEYTWASLSQGIHYYTVTATDKNGATASIGPTYFLVDNANPVLTVSSPTAGIKVKAGTLTISGTATDAGGFGSAPLEITLRHSNTGSPLHNTTYYPTLAGNSFTQNITIDGTTLDGTLYIDFTLTDLAGRQTTLTRAVTIDTTPPVLNLNNPAPGAYINGLVSITGTADDLNGLADVTLEILDPSNLNLVKANINRSGSTLSSWEFPFTSDAYATSTYAQDISGGQGKLWKIWFKLKAVDNAGNETVLKIPPYGALDYPYFVIDLDGDKPSISMTQPKNGDTIGGFVTMFGTATDDDGPVMQVEVQIDFNGDFDFADSRDIDNDSTIQLGTDQNIFGNIVRIGDAAHKWEDESAWYVVNVTNNSWTLEINSNGELYKTNTGGDGNIRIRVRSRDMFGTASEYIERTITLDETFPRIENVSPNDQSYQSATFNMYAEFRDNINLNLSSNSQIRININKTGYQTLTPGPNSGPGHPYALIANGTGYDLTYPVDTSVYFPGTSGILYLDLYVKDESNYTNQRSYTFYIDNQIPNASWSDRAGAPDGNGIRNGQINLNGTTPISFVEGNLSDSGTVSGISHVEVYFVKAGTVRRIQGASGQLTPTTTETTSVDIYDEGTGTWSSSNEVTPFVNWNDSGYGDNYVIKIDRPTEMSSITTGADADGDGYFEFIGIDGGAQRWRAYFNSQYLPDGQIDIHYVVYDLAGNRIHKVRRGFIANSGPAVNRIRIGSDYNGNTVIADVSGSVTEILDYYYPANSIDRYTSNQPVKIKNGRLYFNVQSSDPNGTIASTVINIIPPSPGSRGLLTSFGGASGGNVETNPSSPLTITIGSAQFPTAGDYTLEVVVKDNDNIPTKQTMVIRVLDTADTTKPIITPTTLTQANGIPTSGSTKLGHMELQADNTTGAWNTIKAAYGNDDDPKVSGEINLRGTITDNNRITSLDITGDGLGTNTVIANWDGTQLVSANSRLTIESQALTEDGHTVTFVYRWDTSTVTNVAGLNKTIAFRAIDGSSNNSDPHSTLKFDVVPYITSIQRWPTTTYTSYRSRQGWYSLRQGEAVRINGFNMFATTADTITFNNTSGTTTAFQLNDTNTNTRSKNGFTIISLAATVSSGPVTLTVNSLQSINNINDNTKEYNKEVTVNYQYDGSALWTDDRKVHVWRSDDNQTGNNRGYFTGSADPEYPAMTINSSGVLYGSWSNYASSNIFYAPNNGAATTIFSGYDPSEHTDIHFGSRATVVFNANLYGNVAWNVTGAGGTYIWDENANQKYTGTPTGGVYNAEALYHDQKLMQFINQRIVTNGNNIHVTYYDTDTKALKYFYRTSGDNTYYTQSWINIDGGSDLNLMNPEFETGDLTGWTVTSGTVTAVSNNADTGIWSARLSATNPRMEIALTELLPNTSYTVTLRAKNNNTAVTVYAGVTGHGGTGGAEQSTNSNTYVTLTITFTTGASNTTATLYIGATGTTATRYGYADFIEITGPSSQRAVTNGTRTTAAGEFSAIDLTPTNKYPVIAYYDITRKTVRLARATAVNPSPSQWKLQDVMATGDANYEFSGKYISMKVDSDGYVHMVFFRTSTGDLIYVKSSYAIKDADESDINKTYTFGPSVVIDSIGSVGLWADLTLMNNQPYISYLDLSLVNTFDALKIAYWDPTIDTNNDGNPEGDWEYVNAALGYEVESVRTSIETDTGTNFWQQAIGYSSSDYFRIAYYVKQ